MSPRNVPAPPPKPKRKTAAQRAAEAAAVAAAEAEARLKAKQAERRKFVVRIVALFFASGLTVVTTGAVIGVETWKSVVMGGVAGVAQLVEKLARAAVKDGDVSQKDLDEALSSFAE